MPVIYIWIVNDVTDCNTCLFSVSGLFLSFYFEIVCVRRCVCLCVRVAVNSRACYIWIVNDITDSNICFFSLSVIYLFYSISE